MAFNFGPLELTTGSLVVSGSLLISGSTGLVVTGSTSISGSLIITGSTLSQIITLVPQHPLPTLPTGSDYIGSVATSGSIGDSRLYFWNGLTWCYFNITC